MPATLTLKNIPDEVYLRLKASAERHRRSLNSEAIVCFEAAFMPTTRSPQESLQRARELRAQLGTVRFDPQEIDQLKRQGRP
jgi:plasmid stability protein